jgi:hypothetical protein
MVGAYPLMPLTPAIGLSIAVVTIGGSMGVGVTTDPDLMPGGDELADQVGRSSPPSCTPRASGAARRVEVRPRGWHLAQRGPCW